MSQAGSDASAGFGTRESVCVCECLNSSILRTTDDAVDQHISCSS